MGKTRDIFKKIRDTKGTFLAGMGTIKGNGLDLKEAEDIKKRWQEYTEELYKKDLHDPDNHDGMITDLEPDILECEVYIYIYICTYIHTHTHCTGLLINAGVGRLVTKRACHWTALKLQSTSYDAVKRLCSAKPKPHVLSLVRPRCPARQRPPPGPQITPNPQRHSPSLLSCFSRLFTHWFA